MKFLRAGSFDHLIKFLLISLLTSMSFTHKLHKRVKREGTAVIEDLNWKSLENFAVVNTRVENSDLNTINSTQIVRNQGWRNDSRDSRQGGVGGSRTEDFVLTQKEHLLNISLSFIAGETEYILDLRINRYLFSSDYMETVISKDTERSVKVDTRAINCHYEGEVRGRNDSIAAVSTCNGLEGLIVIGGDIYHIAPLNDGENCLSCGHKIYKNPDDEFINKFRCGLEDHLIKNLTTQSRRKRAAITDFPQDLDRRTRMIEIYLVNDVSHYKSFGNNVSRVLERTRTFVNIASRLLQSQDFYLVIIGSEILTSNTINVNVSDYLGTLEAFLNYRKNSITTPNDLSILISGVGPFQSTTVGLSYVGAICSSAAVLFVADVFPLIAATGTILAHEVGHSLGLVHDNQYPTSCACSDTTGNCIMSAVSSGTKPATQWSQCSIDGLIEAHTKALDICLFNLPTTVFDSTPLCGNGLVDTGEDCDCGSAPTSECNPTCCSNVTCKLVQSAQCAYGRCCNIQSCTLKQKYTECRLSAGPCDLSEYCSGSSPICPSDVFMADYTECAVGSDLAYCYEGLCRSRQSQCTYLWGNSTSVANDLCYSFYNTLGEYYGSCGFKTPGNFDSYLPCADADVMCGTLQCNEFAITLQYPDGWIHRRQATVNTGTNTYFCKTVSYETGLFGRDRGLVPSGASCGTNKVCSNSQCLNIETARSSVPTCPDCHSHGVCNSLGQCHCSVGFGSADCSLPGEGGSPHSNAIQVLQTSTSTTTTSSTLTSSLQNTQSSTPAPRPTTPSRTLSSTISTSTTQSTSVLSSTIVLISHKETPTSTTVLSTLKETPAGTTVPTVLVFSSALPATPTGTASISSEATTTTTIATTTTITTENLLPMSTSMPITVPTTETSSSLPSSSISSTALSTTELISTTSSTSSIVTSSSTLSTSLSSSSTPSSTITSSPSSSSTSASSTSASTSSSSTSSSSSSSSTSASTSSLSTSTSTSSSSTSSSSSLPTSSTSSSLLSSSLLSTSSLFSSSSLSSSSSSSSSSSNTLSLSSSSSSSSLGLSSSISSSLSTASFLSLTTLSTLLSFSTSPLSSSSLSSAASSSSSSSSLSSKPSSSSSSIVSLQGRPFESTTSYSLFSQESITAANSNSIEVKTVASIVAPIVVVALLALVFCLCCQRWFSDGFSRRRYEQDDYVESIGSPQQYYVIQNDGQVKNALPTRYHVHMYDPNSRNSFYDYN